MTTMAWACASGEFANLPNVRIGVTSADPRGEAGWQGRAETGHLPTGLPWFGICRAPAAQRRRPSSSSVIRRADRVAGNSWPTIPSRFVRVRATGDRAAQGDQFQTESITKIQTEPLPRKTVLGSAGRQSNTESQ